MIGKKARGYVVQKAAGKVSVLSRVMREIMRGIGDGSVKERGAYLGKSSCMKRERQGVNTLSSQHGTFQTQGT